MKVITFCVFYLVVASMLNLQGFLLLLTFLCFVTLWRQLCLPVWRFSRFVPFFYS